MVLEISYQNYQRRISRVREEMQKRGLQCMIVANATNIQYMSGFWHVPTERPTVLIIPQDGELILMTGRLEYLNAKDRVPWARVEPLYFDYPGEKPPLTIFAESLAQWGFNKGKIGFDQHEYQSGSHVTSSGDPIPSKTLEPAELTWAGDIISSMRYIRDEEEISILKECVRWGNLGMSIIQDNVAPGLFEAEVSMESECAASGMMLRAMPENWEPYAYGAGPAQALIKAGPRAMLSHRNPSNRKLRKGDVIYANASGHIYGYSDELERNIFVGEPGEKERKLHEVAIKAQDAAFNTYRPGIKCSEVNKASMQVIKEAGYMDYVLHHVGHGIGLSVHEPPFLDDGDSTIMQPGMEFSAEPKLLVPDLGHFGHSDTVLITEDGCEVVTYYPRDIESLTIRL